MKRDLDLCLEILREIEESDWSTRPIALAAATESDKLKVEYHCKILADAGLLVGHEGEKHGRTTMFYRLSWQGHEFLDASRNPTHWEKAKDVAHKSSGGFELIRSVLGTLASEAAKAIIGL